MKERHILREISSVLNVGIFDIPKTLVRFKREIDKMEREINQ